MQAMSLGKTFFVKIFQRNNVDQIRYLIESVSNAFKKNEFPVSINVEMRFLRGSGSPSKIKFFFFFFKPKFFQT